MSTPPEFSNSLTPDNPEDDASNASASGDSLFGPAPSATSSAFDRGGLAALTTLFGHTQPHSAPTSHGAKRTHAEMATNDGEAGTSMDGPPAKRATGTPDSVAAGGDTVPGSGIGA